MAYDPENLFAKILRGELPAHKVYEDGDIFAFMDVFPQSQGHTLVIPKTQAENIFDLEPEWLARLTTGTQKVAKAVRDALNPDGMLITQFNGAAAGQSVMHIHFHIIPRWQATPLSRHGNSSGADHEELAALAKQIAAKL
ncbi:HIT family protein [bacterium AH-315-P15]|nr:HIT family protein [bacterium AH-315-P15]